MHEHHRERMRKRFLEYGFDSFADHEYLETLLYYSKARGDTNPLAHTLMERFGSIRNVLEASPDELMQVEGIGEQTVLLLKVILEGVRRYAASLTEETTTFDTITKIAEYIWCRFLGLDHERLYLMLFNNRMNMIDCSIMSDGTTNTSDAPVGKIVERALQKKAACAVLAHNHPRGLAVPSDNDIAVTVKISEALRLVDIPLREHLVITDDRFSAIVKHHLRYRSFSSPTAQVGGKIPNDRHFYNVDDETYCFPSLFPEEAGAARKQAEKDVEDEEDW